MAASQPMNEKPNTPGLSGGGGGGDGDGGGGGGGGGDGGGTGGAEGGGHTTLPHMRHAVSSCVSSLSTMLFQYTLKALYSKTMHPDGYKSRLVLSSVRPIEVA